MIKRFLRWFLSPCPPELEEPPKRWVRHLKRGTEYEVEGVGEVQNSSGKPIVEGDLLVAYRCLTDGKLWFRSPEEFNDGRFVDV